MRVALVYDRVTKIGGAERLLTVLGEIFPQAPLYTAFYDPSYAPWAKKFKVITSGFNRLPLASSHHELFPLFAAMAFESFDFSNYDLVVSITSAEAKGIITQPKTFHLCYCLTPTRYLWSGYEEYFKNKTFRFLTQPLVNWLRRWDKIAAQRPDTYLAISENVKKRLKKYYQKDSEVIYPPVDTEKFKSSKVQKFKEGYFLIVSRLVAYKKIDVAIKAFNRLGLPLKIVGVGKEMRRLKKMAKGNIEFVGQLTDEELLGYYQKSLALICPQEEDFGLAPLEAQACGTPVIAYRGGGVSESVIEGKTGLFFSLQTPESLIEAVKKFTISRISLKPENCRRNAEKFGKDVFENNFRDFTQEIIRKSL